MTECSATSGSLPQSRGPVQFGAEDGQGGDAIVVEHLSHWYPAAKRFAVWTAEADPHRPALDDLSLRVRCAEIFGILGPNGGGKTTLFRILATMLRPAPRSSLPAARCGTAAIFGLDPVRQPQLVRCQLGVVFQHPSLDTKLTAEENLVHQGRLYGLGGADLRRRIDRWLNVFGLAERRHGRVETFSGGLRRRLELAKALLHEPPLLLMDEPASGLDPGARRQLWRQLERLRAEHGTTIVLTTHLMEEAERCDRLAILAEGSLVALESPAQLKARIGGQVVTVQPDPAAADNQPQQLAQLIHQRFGPWPNDTAPKVVDGSVRFSVPEATQFAGDLASAFPGRVRSVTVGQPTLDDVFLKLTGSVFSATDSP